MSADHPNGKIADLTGARYQIDYYGGQFSTKAEADASSVVKKTWIVKTKDMTTDADGTHANAMISDYYTPEGVTNDFFKLKWNSS